MKTHLISIIAGVLFAGSVNTQDRSGEWFEGCVSFSLEQVNCMLNRPILNFNNLFPVTWLTNDKNGLIIKTNMHNLQSPYYAGCMWYAYELSGQEAYRKQAIRWTMYHEKVKDETFTNVGMLFTPNFLNATRLHTDNSFIYNSIIYVAAANLARSFNEDVACFKFFSDEITSKSGRTMIFPMTTESLLNIEFILWAANNTKFTAQKNDWRRKAITHANTIARLFIRAGDSSVYDVIDVVGTQIGVFQPQALHSNSDTSTWTKSQVSALYGFMKLYQYTNQEFFLLTAKRLAGYYMQHVYDDKIPLWDMNLPDKKYQDNQKDVTSATIAVSAILDLYNATKEERYLNFCTAALKSLATTNYRTVTPGSNGCFILKHCILEYNSTKYTDNPHIIADYYLLECLTKYKKIIQS